MPIDAPVSSVSDNQLQPDNHPKEERALCSTRSEGENDGSISGEGNGRGVECIAIGGDLLVFTDNDGNDLSEGLLVYSLLLRRVSKILADKFIAYGKEGSYVEGLRVNYVLNLPDEDHDTVKLFCKHLHCDDQQTLFTDTAEVRQLAMFANKYECTEWLSFRCVAFFQDMSATRSMLGGWAQGKVYWDLLTAAYWLKNKIWFQKFSEKIMESHKGSYLSFTLDFPDRALGLKLALALTEAKSMFQSFGRRAGLCLICFEAATVNFQPQAFCFHCGSHKDGGTMRTPAPEPNQKSAEAPRDATAPSDTMPSLNKTPGALDPPAAAPWSSTTAGVPAPSVLTFPSSREPSHASVAPVGPSVGVGIADTTSSSQNQFQNDAASMSQWGTKPGLSKSNARPFGGSAELATPAKRPAGISYGSEQSTKSKSAPARGGFGGSFRQARTEASGIKGEEDG